MAMKTVKKKTRRLRMKIVRVGKTPLEVVNLPVHPDATLGEMQDLENLLNKVYAPDAFDLQYEWETVNAEA